MAKFKRPKPKKKTQQKLSALRALPCLVMLLVIFALLWLLFFYGLKA